MASLTSGVWGDKAYDISQGFGVYNPETADMYAYAADYGWPAGTHIGLDVAVPKLTKIYAATDGVVQEAGPSDSFRPNPVRVLEPDGDVAIYGHLWEDSVASGQKVKKGQLLGYSGEQTVRGTMTPDGTGPHIHFELRRPDPVTGAYVAVDPTSELGGTDSFTDTAGGGSFTDVSISSGLTRVLFFTGGVMVIALGLWAMAGRPPLTIAGIARKVVS